MSDQVGLDRQICFSSSQSSTLTPSFSPHSIPPHSSLPSVDDGTGAIKCSWWRGQTSSHEQDQQQSEAAITLGNLVTVMGRISLFREQREIMVNTISILTCLVDGRTIIIILLMIHYIDTSNKKIS